MTFDNTFLAFVLAVTTLKGFSLFWICGSARNVFYLALATVSIRLAPAVILLVA